MRPKETDYAWAAGIVDGEGAITMVCAKAGINRRTTLGFQVRICVRMTHFPTVERLHRIFGGVLKIAASRNVEKHKPTLDWYVGDVKTVEALNKMRPYLVTKRAQCDLVLRFRKTCFPPRPTTGRNTVSKRLADKRLAFFTQLKALNKKGPSGGPK